MLAEYYLLTGIMNHFPKVLIFDVKSAYIQFISAVSEPNLPTIDEDAVLSLVVETLRHRQTIEYEMMNLQKQMVEGEGLVEKAIVEDLNNVHFFCEEADDLRTGLDCVAIAAKNIGRVIETQVVSYGLREDDFFNYEYGGIINNGTIILRRCA